VSHQKRIFAQFWALVSRLMIAVGWFNLVDAVASEMTVKRAVDDPWSGGSRRAHKLNGMGETRLHIAARLNKVADVVTLLMEGADINARDYAGIYAVFDTPHCRGKHRNF